MSITYIDNADSLQKLNQWLSGRSYFSFDIETGPGRYAGTPDEGKAGLDPHKGEIVLFLVGDLNEQFVVDNRAGLDLSVLRAAVESPTVVKVGLNLRFDTKFVMRQLGWIPARLLDVMVTEQVIRAGLFSADDKASVGQIRKMTSMASLVRFYFGQEIDKDKEMRIGFWKTPIGGFSERQMQYFQGDIQWPEKIARVQKPIVRERGLGKTLDLEYRLIPVLADMELEGMELDVDAWLDLYQQACTNVIDCEVELDRVFGLRAMVQDDLFGEAKVIRKVKYSSPAQLARLLHSRGVAGFVDELGNTLTTESKKFVIGKMMGEVAAEIADPIIAMRKAEQRRDSYGLNFINAIHPVTNRIHPDFTQTILVTGRISCSPGLQTIPRDAAYRKAFVAGDGYLLSIADASQIEARIITDLTQDPMAVAVFNDTEHGKPDIYKHDGELFYGCKIDKNTPEGKRLRDNAKAAWLGLGYGQGKKKFRMFAMLNTGRVISQQDSDYLYDKFFEVHSVMKEQMDQWSNLVDPENSDRFFDDGLADSQIRTDKVYPILYDAMLRKSRGDKAKADLRTRKLLAHRNEVRYATAYGGRKRFFRSDYLGWYTAGRNAPVQTGAAHIQKESMVEMWEMIRNRGYDAKLINAVHDEILVKVRQDQAEEFYTEHARVMTEVGQRYLQHVPMLVEGGLTPFWRKF